MNRCCAGWLCGRTLKTRDPTLPRTEASERIEFEDAAVIFDRNFVRRHDDNAAVLECSYRVAQTFVHQQCVLHRLAHNTLHFLRARKILAIGF